MSENDRNPHVPMRLVLVSLAALWVCYFALATLRGAFVGFDLEWVFISRRLTICILSMLVMAALVPLLQLLDRKPFGTRVTVVLIGALPVAVGLSMINEAVFFDVQQKIESEEAAGNVTIRRDDGGNLLIDLPPVPAPPPSPEVDQTSAARPAVPGVPRASAPGEDDFPISEDAPDTEVSMRVSDAVKRWAIIADTAFGRYFLVLAWAALYFALAKAEEARAAERREGTYRRAAEAAELRSLRYQVNPHFLFNTLNSLSALVMTERADDAERMIQTLSTFYRHTLSGDPTGDSALVDEIEMQKLYLAIEAVRFPRRLLTKIDIDEDAARAMVPGMILQPLVENSVKYAVSASQEPVTISIAARRRDGKRGSELEIVVSDDGPGAADARQRGAISSFGIGLANVRDRLHARYGEAGRIAFGPQDGGGFRTVLTVPLETKQLELPRV